MILKNSKVLYMKKLLCAVICLLFILAACSEGAAEKIDDRPMDDALITIDGKTVLTVQEYNNFVIENEISHELNGSDLLSEEELFKTQAEYTCAAFLSELFDVQADLDEMYLEYDDTISELNSNLDTKALEYNAKLRNALGMTEKEFRDWCANYSYIRTSANNLIEDISLSYAYITNGEAMAEEIIMNLRQMLNDYGFECSLDGYTDYIPDFNNIV
jgi:lipoprotein